MRLRDRVAVVTGGGHGIGAAIAQAFAAEGAAVVIAGTRAGRLEATAAAIGANGGRARAVVADVADEAAVVPLIATAVSEFGRLDILVNNAGIGGPTAPADAITREEWDRTLAVNVTGAFLCAKHALPHLKGPTGRILNITSIAGQMGYALRAPYAASKWAMIGLSRTLAVEAGGRGVTVNAIAPGPVTGERVTDVIRARAAVLGRSFEDIEHDFVDPLALKRMVDAEDVAATAVFLASDDARNITGQTIQVAAGFRV